MRAFPQFTSGTHIYEACCTGAAVDLKIMRHTVRKQQRKILKFADIVVFQHHHRQVRPDLIPAGKRACVCPVIGTAGIVEAMRIAADNGSVNEIVSGIQKILRIGRSGGASVEVPSYAIKAIFTS